MKYFFNRYPDYDGISPVHVDSVRTQRLIEHYVNDILQNKNFTDGDIYVGTSGIAAMFLKLHQSQVSELFNQTALQHAKTFINHAKRFIGKKLEETVSFLCGNSGIYAVSSVIADSFGDHQSAQQELNQFLMGNSVCHKIHFNSYGSDELLFGRAGYLSGIYWLNQNFTQNQKISPDVINKICDVMIEAGIQYSHNHKLKIPMMWESKFFVLKSYQDTRMLYYFLHLHNVIKKVFIGFDTLVTKQL